MTPFSTMNTHNGMGHLAKDAGRASMTLGDLITLMTSGSYIWEENQLRSDQVTW